MNRSTILILEDNPERLHQFESAVAELGQAYRLRTWRDAKRMIAECHEALADGALISLDHDLVKENSNSPDPGDGLQVAEFLAKLPPICPVILHTSNTERVWSMHNEFRFGGWPTERVIPLGDEWIPASWLRTARSTLEKAAATPDAFYHPAKDTHQQLRLSRAVLSLHGLAIGDGLGEMMFSRPHQASDLILKDELPAGPWWHTDDTEMAISVLEVLRLLGSLHQDALAKQFAWRFERDPDRGYGSGARQQLRKILEGCDWRTTAREAFSGHGSLGNGSAMRVAPVGAWFADDLDRAIHEAHASAAVTHMHPEGIAGAVATAVAAAMAWRLRAEPLDRAIAGIFEQVLVSTPDSETRRGIAEAFRIRDVESPQAAAKILGNGARVTCPDTVPFALWVAAKNLRNYPEALAATASVGGDTDTNCAIVGGIVALSTGWQAIPNGWLQSMEPLPYIQAQILESEKQDQ